MSLGAAKKDFQALCTCKDVEDAANALALLLRAQDGVCSVGVFLRDYSGEHLVLTGKYPDPVRKETEEHGMVSSFQLNDPLCYCLYTAQFVYSCCTPEDLPDSAQLLLSNAVTAHALSAYPLIAPRERAIGAVLIGHAPAKGRKIEKANDYAEALCLYAGAVLHGHIEQRRSSATVQGLQQDYKRLEDSKAQRRTNLGRIIGVSDATSSLRHIAQKAAETDAPVLITGETGTGKSLLAKIIHEVSERSANPIVEINCGALPANLLESELFGHVKGAFSDAVANHTGLFRSAEGGTVFLDEIGELPMQLQPALLHVLQDKRVRPVGSTHWYSVNVRIIAATNKNLEAAIEAGEFRRDLYHRLAVVPVHIPSLSDRPEDVLPLAEKFFSHFREKYNKKHLHLHPKGSMFLQEQRFSGNVRELASLIERSILLADDACSGIGPEELSGTPERAATTMTLTNFLERQEEAMIRSAYSMAHGSVTDCAELLGLHPKTMSRKLKKYVPKGLEG